MKYQWGKNMRRDSSYFAHVVIDHRPWPSWLPMSWEGLPGSPKKPFPDHLKPFSHPLRSMHSLGELCFQPRAAGPRRAQARLRGSSEDSSWVRSTPLSAVLQALGSCLLTRCALLRPWDRGKTVHLTFVLVPKILVRAWVPLCTNEMTWGRREQGQLRELEHGGTGWQKHQPGGQRDTRFSPPSRLQVRHKSPGPGQSQLCCEASLTVRLRWDSQDEEAQGPCVTVSAWVLWEAMHGLRPESVGCRAAPPSVFLPCACLPFGYSWARAFIIKAVAASTVLPEVLWVIPVNYRK